MPAAATDKFRKSYSFLTKSLSSNVDSSTTTIPLNNTTNVPTDTAVDFIIDRVDTNGTRTPTARELCSGVVSGSNIVSVTRGIHGTTAQSHTSGAVVEFVNSGAAWNDLMDGILVAHDQDGTLKAGAVDAAAVLASDVVTTAKILNSNVTTAKINDGAVTANKLATGATGAFITASETTTSTSYADLSTVQSVTVTVGANGLLLVGYAANMKNDTANAFCMAAPALTGANTDTASDNYAAKYQAYTANAEYRIGGTKLYGGLAAGSTTVTLKFHVQTGGGGAGTGTFSNRELWAVPL